MKKIMMFALLVAHFGVYSGGGVIIKSDVEYSSDEDSFSSVESVYAFQDSSEETFEDLLIDGLCQLDLDVENEFIASLTFQDYEDNKELFESSLYEAVKKLKIKRIEKLLDLNIPADIKIKGTTMLCYLCNEGRYREKTLLAIKLFLKHGSSVYQMYDKGETLLQYVKRANYKVARVLQEFSEPENACNYESPSNSDSESDPLDAEEVKKAGFLGDFLERDDNSNKLFEGPISDQKGINALKKNDSYIFRIPYKITCAISLIAICAACYGYSYHTKSNLKFAK